MAKKAKSGKKVVVKKAKNAPKASKKASKVAKKASSKVAKKASSKVAKKASSSKKTSTKGASAKALAKKTRTSKAKPTKRPLAKVTSRKSPANPSKEVEKNFQVGDKAPAFTLETDRGETVSKDGLLGQKVVLYFYPKDNTSGCTKQACEFQASLGRLADHDAVVIGVSPDSAKSHEKFRSKFGLTFPLGLDEDLGVAKKFGVWVEKSMYGRKYMGIQRSTFLIDRKGNLAAIWLKVKVEGHVDEVLSALESVP